MTKKIFCSLFIIFSIAFSIHTKAQIITTIAGNGAFGWSGDGGPATAAAVSYPSAVAIDGPGNVYFADKNNNVIRKISPSGIISTVAGNGYGAGVVSGFGGYSGDNGPATAAELNYPWAVAVDGPGNLYIADRVNNVMRKVSTSGIITTFAGNGVGAGLTGPGTYSGDGGPATAAGLYFPSGVAVDTRGNVFIADCYNNVIRKVDTSGIISTFAGNHTGLYSGDGGPATAAGISDPYGIAFDAAGNVYIADRNNYAIRKIDALGIISTIAGNHTLGYTGDGGPATAASFGVSDGIATDRSGNIYFSDASYNVIRKINTSGIISSDSASKLNYEHR